MKQMNKFSALLALILFTGTVALFASDGITSWQLKGENSKSFIENKGQFRIASDKAIMPSTVKYAFDDGTTTIYFTPTGVTYSFLKRWRREGGNAEERAKERVREQKEMAKGKSHAEMEKEEHLMKFKSDVVTMTWENANHNAELIALEPTTDYFIYPDKTTQNEKNIENIKAYKKLIYKNLYPNIDVEYVFHPQSGIKYSLILHPGADISVVKMKYSDAIHVNDKGELCIKTKFGDIIEHAPLTFLQGNESSIIPSKFIKNGKTISFLVGDYDKTKTLVVDPWVQTPTLSNSNGVWECEKDASGNVYIIGGDMPMKLQKYNSAGVLQWTYNTPWDTANYWLGTLATDQAGFSYVTAGSSAKIQKISPAGALVWNASGGALDEFWTIAFNCNQTILVVGGTRLGPFPPAGSNGVIFEINTSTGATTSVKKVGWSRTTTIFGFPVTDIEEVRSITSSYNARYYYLTLDTVGAVDQNFSACPSSSTLFGINDGYSLGYKSEDYRPNNGNAGMCAIRANKNFVYTQNGTTVQKRNPTTGATITSVTIPGGISTSSGSLNQAGNSGIDLDSCGNVYVGSGNAIIKYDANLVLLSSVAVPFRVSDVSVSYGGDVIVCGTTGNNSNPVRTGYVQSINMSACYPMLLACCNTTICPLAPVCVTDAPFNIVSSAPGGTWSGTGITNAALGTFSPSAAGSGTFTISYTMACGTGTISITVNPCTATSACAESSGQITVSGGTGPYTWQEQVTTTPCVPGVGFCSGIGTVAGPPVTSWSTFTTGTTVTPPATYPIQVIDNSGTTLLITSFGSLPPCSASCPPLTVNITSQVNVACFGASTGSFNASTTGGATPWDYTLMNGAATIAVFTNISGTQSFTGLPAGTYTLNVLDNDGCPGTITITITQPAAATTVANAGPGQSACSASATMAGNTPTIGTGAWTLVSGTGTITSTGSSTTTITGLGTGANVFMWTISNPPCPSTSDTVTIINTGGPTTANAGTAQSVCGTTATLAGNIPAVGTGTWTLVSGAGTITAPTSASSGITGLGSGANIFMWTISNPPCTSSTSTVTITGVAPPTTSNAGPDQSICSSSAILSGNAPSIGAGTWTLVSGSGTLTSPSSPTSGVTGLGVGANVFMWTISNSPCTSSTSTVTITNTGGPSISVTSQTNVNCSGASTGAATVAGSGGSGSYTYAWTGGAGTSTTASSLSAGTYTVTVTDGAGCSGTTIVNITQPAAISGTVNTTAANCGVSDGTASVSASGGTGALTYSWAPGGATTSAITGIPAGSYTVTIMDSLGCVNSASGSVGSVGGPSVNAGADATIVSGASILLTGTASTGATFSWSPSATLSCDTCASPIASPAQTTTYTLTVTLNGCSSYDTVTVFVELECGELFVPNVFSPNGDGANDVLKVYGNCITDLEFVIFDRWGQKVFEITDPLIVWDGRYNGKLMDAAVFVYYLKAKVKGIDVKKHGNITLVK